MKSKEYRNTQILANLVSNAIKYAPPGGDVRLNAGVEGDTLFITISDSGPGFIPEDREVLYSKFRKLSAKPSGGERSTGLGLYIVKQLADACNKACRALVGGMPPPDQIEPEILRQADMSLAQGYDKLLFLLENDDAMATTLFGTIAPMLEQQNQSEFARLDKAINNFDYDRALQLLPLFRP